MNGDLWDRVHGLDIETFILWHELQSALNSFKHSAMHLMFKESFILSKHHRILYLNKSSLLMMLMNVFQMNISSMVIIRYVHILYSLESTLQFSVLFINIYKNTSIKLLHHFCAVRFYLKTSLFFYIVKYVRLFGI